MSGALRNHLVKLVVGAGKATPSPPIGPALGSKGIKSIDFCKEFNARTQEYITGTPLPCRVIVRPDRTYTFDIRTPQTSWLIFNAADVGATRRGKSRGANKPGHETIGTISLKHVYEIAKIKATELRLSGIPLEGLCRAIIWQTKSMGIKVIP